MRIPAGSFRVRFAVALAVRAGFVGRINVLLAVRRRLVLRVRQLRVRVLECVLVVECVLECVR